MCGRAGGAEAGLAAVARGLHACCGTPRRSRCAPSAAATRPAPPRGPEVAITGTLTTENLGIERLVANAIANPHLRFVLVCGPEAGQRTGHHPGGSLLALAANGTGERAWIIAAPGRRPRLRNLTPAQIARFRAHVGVIDLTGTQDAAAVLDAARSCAARDPGPAPRPPGGAAVPARRDSLAAAPSPTRAWRPGGGARRTAAAAGDPALPQLRAAHCATDAATATDAYR